MRGGYRRRSGVDRARHGRDGGQRFGICVANRREDSRARRERVRRGGRDLLRTRADAALQHRTGRRGFHGRICRERQTIRRARLSRDRTGRSDRRAIRRFAGQAGRRAVGQHLRRQRGGHAGVAGGAKRDHAAFRHDASVAVGPTGQGAGRARLRGRQELSQRVRRGAAQLRQAARIQDELQAAVRSHSRQRQSAGGGRHRSASGPGASIRPHRRVRAKRPVSRADRRAHGRGGQRRRRHNDDGRSEGLSRARARAYSHQISRQV